MNNRWKAGFLAIVLSLMTALSVVPVSAGQTASLEQSMPTMEQSVPLIEQAYEYEFPKLGDSIYASSESGVYKQALKILKNRDYNSGVYCTTSSMYKYANLLLLILTQHPEYNYGLGVYYSYSSTGAAKIGYQICYSNVSEAGIRKKMIQTDKKAKAVIKKIIKKGMSDQQKLKAIHDYLVKNCKYDMNAAYSSSSSYSSSFSAYGCLVKKKAVCQGYSAAFNLLAAKCKIPSMMVAGGNHGWNYVKVGKSYRFIDVTWDDPVPDRGKNAPVSQTYFMVTASVISRDHYWVKTDYPKKYLNYCKYLY